MFRCRLRGSGFTTVEVMDKLQDWESEILVGAGRGQDLYKSVVARRVPSQRVGTKTVSLNPAQGGSRSRRTKTVKLPPQEPATRPRSSRLRRPAARQVYIWSALARQIQRLFPKPRDPEVVVEFAPDVIVEEPPPRPVRSEPGTRRIIKPHAPPTAMP